MLGEVLVGGRRVNGGEMKLREWLMGFIYMCEIEQ
jgi:hypothetical protein